MADRVAAESDPPCRCPRVGVERGVGVIDMRAQAEVPSALRTDTPTLFPSVLAYATRSSLGIG
jgi:hypothetical protein